MSGPPLRTAAVVLRARPIRESDLMLVLLTRERGRVDAVARGARRSRRRFPGGIPVGRRGEATLAPGRGEIWRLDGLDAVGDHGVVGRDLERFAYVAYVCELAEALITGTSPDGDVFELVDRTVAEIIADPPHPAWLRRLEIRLLDALGLAPALDTCAVCSATVAESSATEVAFDLRRGGALCRDHAAAARRCARTVLETAARLSRGDDADVAVEALSKADRRALRDLCLAAIHQHISRPLRSTEFFASVAGAIDPATSKT